VNLQAIRIKLQTEIKSACQYMGIRETSAEAIAAIVDDRLELHVRAEAGGIDHLRLRRERDERIRADYNGQNVEALAKREGISARQVRRIANGS
jgi:hypothetical protein